MVRKKKTEANGSEANGSDGEEASIGHNGGEAGISEEKYFEAKRDILSKTRIKDSAVAELRQARKRAKDAGVNLKQFDLVQKLAAYTGPELTADLNKLVSYAKFEKLAVYSQLSILDFQEPSEEDRLVYAYEQGVVAGKGGAPRQAPWDVVTPMGNKWLNGFDDGQRELAGGLKAKTTSTEEPATT